MLFVSPKISIDYMNTVTTGGIILSTGLTLLVRENYKRSRIDMQHSSAASIQGDESERKEVQE